MSLILEKYVVNLPSGYMITFFLSLNGRGGSFKNVKNRRKFKGLLIDTTHNPLPPHLATRQYLYNNIKFQILMKSLGIDFTSGTSLENFWNLVELVEKRGLEEVFLERFSSQNPEIASISIFSLFL